MSSICEKVCEYISDDIRICRGCGRNAEEITEWMTATKERKIEIAHAARQRTKEYRTKKVIASDLV